MPREGAPPLNLNPLSSLLAAVVVLLIGTMINRKVWFLSKYNIPDPITGGLRFAALAAIAWLAVSFKVEVALSAGPFLVIILMQTVFIILYAIYVCFRFMGRDYEAAVSSAAFIGFCMGSTATAMANMQAITAKYGPAPQSYLIVPLAGAFFIDLMNAFLLTLILAVPFMGG